MLLLAPLLLTLACAPKVPPPAAPAVAQVDEHAPLPYTADQIRAAMPAGARLRFSLEIEGGPPMFQEWLVTDATALDMELEATVRDAQGAVVEGPARERSTWESLRQHAAFPAATTTRMEARLDTAMGPQDCWLYQIEGAGPDGQPQTDRYWFARALPGPPVLWERSRGAEVVMRLTQLERAPMP